MSDLVNIADLDKEIEKILKENFREVASKVVATTNHVADKVKINLKMNSPERTGYYAYGWSTKKRDSRKDSIFGAYEVIVHNATSWQLTHLLEYGHAANNGTSRVKAYPHIRPAEEEAAKEYYNELKKRLLEE